jgi:hypothetical protein
VRHSRASPRTPSHRQGSFFFLKRGEFSGKVTRLPGLKPVPCARRRARWRVHPSRTPLSPQLCFRETRIRSVSRFPLLFPSPTDTDGAVSTVPEPRTQIQSPMLPIVAGPLAAVAAQLGCTGARIRVGRTRQLAVSAEGSYTGPVDPRSSNTFGAVSAQRGNSSRGGRLRAAARAEARGYIMHSPAGRLYPRSADLRTYFTQAPR